MERTTIMLPHELKLQIAQQARRKGISMGGFIRDAITAALSKAGENGRSEDPLFSDREFFPGSAPADMAANHDDYLYGKK